MNTKTSIIILAAIFSQFLAVNIIRAQVLTSGFTYQGRLVVGGNSSTNGFYDFQFQVFDTDGVSSTGNSYGSPNPNNLVRVGVTNGLFTVLLNFGSGMPTVFDGNPRWLQISVRTNGVGTYSMLNPRQALTPTPYAIYSANAAQLGGHTSTAYVSKAGDTMTGPLNLPPNGLAVGDEPDALWDLVVSGHKVGIGTAGPGALLDIAGNGLLGTTYQELIQGVGSTLALGANSTAAEVQSQGGVPLYINHGGNNVIMLDSGGGNVGIGTTTPHALLEINSPSSDVSGQEFQRFSFGPSDYDSITAFFNGNSERSALSFNVEYATGDIRSIMTLKGDAVGIGTIDPQATLHVAAQRGAVLQLSNTGGDPDPLNSVQGSINFGSPSGPSAQGKITYGTDTGFAFWAGGAIKMNILEDGTVSVPVLQINGADVAEPFDLSAKDISKGSLMIIDENNPGKLKLSECAYDNRVAGILSGANGVHPGIRLKQVGFNDHGEEIALSGRVYALADASYGAIKPGDLLTTSDTPGHCMKVTDHALAQGAIVGKAMSSLQNGRGMVLVLVSLQ